MWPRFGIKIGNSTLCIASVKEDGKIEVIANKQGDRVSQACLLWDGNEVECGLTAKQKMATRPTQAVANSFQFLVPSEELTEEKIAAASKEIPCAFDAETREFELIVANDDELQPKKLSTYEVHVQLLKSEFELARQFLHGSDDKPIVVLSIPSYYSAAAWPQLAQAAEEAGFHVAQIITEPTAAVLANGIGESADAHIDKPLPTKYVLTVKCGGLYSHFALYEVTNGLYTLLDCQGPFSIGGKQYTEAIVQFICQEFYKKFKLDPNESRRSMAKIRANAANCKHILTMMPTTQIYIDSLMDGVDFNMQMSRARYESLIQPVINNFMQTLSETLEKMFKRNTQVAQIDEIVLLGATMQTPKLQAAVSARFPEAKLNTSLAADEVVAVGCARQATFLADPAGQDLNATEECVCAEAELLIWHGADASNAKVVLRKGTILPSVVTVEVQSDATEAAAAVGGVFHLKVGDEINEVCLENATASENGTFKIEADVSIAEADNEGALTTTPVIKLRCI